MAGGFFGLGPLELIIIALCLGIPVLGGIFALIYFAMRSGKDDDAMGGDE